MIKFAFTGVTAVRENHETCANGENFVEANTCLSHNIAVIPLKHSFIHFFMLYIYILNIDFRRMLGYLQQLKVTHSTMKLV